MGAAAQSWPSRPVTLVVPYGADGPADTLARSLGESMRASLGQPVVVENVAGANGTIGGCHGRSRRAPAPGRARAADQGGENSR
jgi:tripartite-type tricarboxylate transporter receptor subunit TctC